MAFNIHQSLFQPNGYKLDQEATTRYIDTLIELFASSAERRALDHALKSPSWTSHFLTLGLQDIGVKPTNISFSELDEILFNLFPEKILTAPGDANEILEELVAFWSFLKRYFRLDNAQECIEWLVEEETLPILEEGLDTFSNFGETKLFALFCLQEGFDISDESQRQEAIDAFQKIRKDRLKPLQHGGPPRPGKAPRKRNNLRKNRRKASRTSRRRNRKRK